MRTWQSALILTQAQQDLGRQQWAETGIFNAIKHAAASPAQFLTLLPPDQSNNGASKGSAWRQLFPL